MRRNWHFNVIPAWDLQVISAYFPAITFPVFKVTYMIKYLIFCLTLFWLYRIFALFIITTDLLWSGQCWLLVTIYFFQGTLSSDSPLSLPMVNSYCWSSSFPLSWWPICRIIMYKVGGYMFSKQIYQINEITTCYASC